MIRRNIEKVIFSPTLLFYWKIIICPYFMQVLAIFGLMLMGALLDSLTVILTVPMLDVVMKSENGGGGRVYSLIEKACRLMEIAPSGNIVVLGLLVVLVTLFIIRSGFYVINQYYTTLAAQKVRRDLRSSLLGRYLCAQYDVFAKKDRGAIARNIVAPADSLFANLRALGSLFTAIVDAFFLLGTMFYLSPWATTVIGVLAVLLVKSWRLVSSGKTLEASRTIFQLDRSEAKLEIDAVDGIKVVKSFVLQPSLLKKHKDFFRAELRPQLLLTIFKIGPTFVNETAACLAMLLLGIMAVLYPQMGVSFSVLGAFLFAIRRMSPAVATLNSSLVELHQFKPNIEVVDEVLNKLPQEHGGRKSITDIQKLKFTNVNFQYSTEGGSFALRNVNLEMQKGTVTALVGPTGSGKSTFAQLVLRLYDPTSGEISVNGEDLRLLDLDQWRRKIGYVGQDLFLFNATLRENIALWKEMITLEDVEDAARLAQLHDFVLTLPQGYETIVGDRGAKLSGGQCQRVAIARAILHKPKLLIFDEATSALDNITEKAIYDAISSLRMNTLIIAIAHRLSTVRHADQIVVFSKGEIVEKGQYDQLIKATGLFWKMHQSGNAVVK